MSGPVAAEFLTLAEHVQSWGPAGVYIYGLYDPRDNELRYIGKSVRPRERLADQLNEHSNTHRSHWLAELQSLGLLPIQRIIDALPAGHGWQTVERAYIRGARAASCNLVNGTDGGDGVEGLSDETRARMRLVWLGRKHTPESRAKMAAASRGKIATPQTRRKRSQSLMGREILPEHRLKIRDGNQKLTADQVREVRRRLRLNESQYALAAEYGVHQGTISNISRGKSYAHINQEDQ
jgi:hypothetical protein